MSDELDIGDIIIDESQFDDPLAVVDALDSDELRASLSTFITNELESAFNERVDRELMWQTWRRHREARPEQKVKNYPFPNASNVVPPEMLAKTNSVYAQLRAKYSVKRPLFQVESLVGDPLQANAIEKLLDILVESPQHLNFRAKNNVIAYDTPSLGDTFVKVHWDIQKWNFQRSDNEQIEKIAHDGPQITPLQIEDFITRTFYTDLNRAKWYAIRTRYYKHELEQKVKQGYFKPDQTQIVLGMRDTDMPAHIVSSESAHGEASNPSESDGIYTIYEVSVFWDVNNDGVDEDIRFFYHDESGQILRIEYSVLGTRDVVQFIFVPLPFDLYNMGIGMMGESTQEELTSLHNISVNSLHYSSLQMLAVRRGSGMESEELYPSKRWEMDDPNADFQVIKFPSVTNEVSIIEESARRNIAVATNVSPAMSGASDNVMKSRFSQKGYSQQASMGSGMLDLVTNSMDASYAQVGQLLLHVIVSNGERAKVTLGPLLDDESRVHFESICDINVEDIPQKFAFAVRTTAMDETRDAKRQMLMTMNTLLAQYNQEMIQYMQMLSNPQIQQMQQLRESLSKLVVARTRLMEDTLEFFGQEDPKEFLLYVDDLDVMNQMLELQKAPMVQEVKNAIASAKDGALSGGVSGGPSRVTEEPGLLPSGQGAGGQASTGPEQSGALGSDAAVSVSGPS